MLETRRMASREQVIEKIKTLPDESLSEVADFLEQLEDRSRLKPKKKADILSRVIGACEGPADLAESHDRYAYE
jgi:hypothetical protein